MSSAQTLLAVFPIKVRVLADMIKVSYSALRCAIHRQSYLEPDREQLMVAMLGCFPPASGRDEKTLQLLKENLKNRHLTKYLEECQWQLRLLRHQKRMVKRQLEELEAKGLKNAHCIAGAEYISTSLQAAQEDQYLKAWLEAIKSEGMLNLSEKYYLKILHLKRRLAGIDSEIRVLEEAVGNPAIPA